MQYCPSMMTGKGDGPLDLIQKDREALKRARQRPQVHKTIPRYSPLREHVSTLRLPVEDTDLSLRVLERCRPLAGKSLIVNGFKHIVHFG